jgi:basic amino acid/polyamine antiporter, APA family
VMGIYLLLNLVALYVVPMKDFAGNNFVLGTVANLVFGHLGDPIIRSIMLVSLLSAMNANQLFCPRTLYAMSSDGLFFRAATKVNAGGTPTIALLLSTIAGVLFLLTGTFERVIAMLSFFFVANYTLTYTSLFVLRKREPNLERPYRAWGYPWTTGIALGGSILFLIASLLTDKLNAPWSLAILALSYPVYLILNWTRKQGA